MTDETPTPIDVEQIRDNLLRFNSGDTTDSDLDDIYDDIVDFMEATATNLVDRAIALAALHKLARKNHRDAIFALGTVYHVGWPIRYEGSDPVDWDRSMVDLPRACSFYARITDKTEAANNLGVLYISGVVKGKFRLGYELLRDLAVSGLPKATYNLCLALAASAQGVSYKEFHEAMSLMLDQAQRGEPNCCNLAGIICDAVHEGPGSLMRSRVGPMFLRASEMGHQSARLNYALALARGVADLERGPQPDRAFSSFVDAMNESGNPMAPYARLLVASCLFHGIGTTRAAPEAASALLADLESDLQKSPPVQSKCPFPGPLEHILDRRPLEPLAREFLTPEYSTAYSDHRGLYFL